MIMGMYGLLCTCGMGLFGGMESPDGLEEKPRPSGSVPHPESVLSMIGMRIEGCSAILKWKKY
jgi:hypothetical protein